MKKKIFWGFLIFLIFLSFSGCVRPSGDYLTPEQIQAQIANKLMEAIVIEDLPAVKSLLCPGFQDTHPELEKELQDIFDFIDGDIVSYDEPQFLGYSGGSTTPKDGWVEKDALPKIKNVKTSSGKTYEIGFGYYFVNKEHPELLGVSYINVILDEDEKNPLPEDGPIIQYWIDAEVFSE